MAVKGRMKYVPGIVIEALDDIKRSENIRQDSFAFEKLVNLAEIGKIGKIEENDPLRKGRRLRPFFPEPF